MLDWIKARWTGECLLRSDRHQPLLVCHRGQTRLFVFLEQGGETASSRLRSPQNNHLRQEDRCSVFCYPFFFFSPRLLWDLPYFFLLFFFPSAMHLVCQDLSLSGCSPPPTPFVTCIHGTDPHWSFQTNLMGFLQQGEKLRGFFPPTLFGSGGNWFPMALFLKLFQLMLVLGAILKLYSSPIEAAVWWLRGCNPPTSHPLPGSVVRWAQVIWLQFARRW